MWVQCHHGQPSLEAGRGCECVLQDLPPFAEAMEARHQPRLCTAGFLHQGPQSRSDPLFTASPDHFVFGIVARSLATAAAVAFGCAALPQLVRM